MKQKLIFLDVDGTFTMPGTNVPPPSALEAMHRAQEKGHKVVVCSGRNCGMLAPVLPCGFDGVIASAGGYIEYGGEVIYDCPMTPEQQERAMTVLKKNGIFRTAEGKYGNYADEEFKFFLLSGAPSGSNSELIRWQEALEKELNIRPMSEYGGEPLYKITFMCPGRENLREPMRALEEEFQFCIQGELTGLLNGELINRKFNKGTALRRLSGYLRIPLEDTIAFGDSMNDVEMIETAGLGICMGGGSEALKRLAGEVCPAVEEDGLYRAFEKHGLV